MVKSTKNRLVTPVLWLVVGAGLGFLSLEVIGVPVLIACLVVLGVRAAGSRNTRHWADLAGLLLGAGLLASIFALPDSLIPSCSGHTFSAGCDASGRCWSTGPTSCTDGHVVFMAIGAAACLFMLGAVAIGAWLVARASLVRREGGVE